VGRGGGLRVGYAERGKEYGILFMYSLFCEYAHLGYERVRVIYRVNQAESGIRILVVAPQEYVNIYSTRRGGGRWILSISTGTHTTPSVTLNNTHSRTLYKYTHTT